MGVLDFFRRKPQPELQPQVERERTSAVAMVALRRAAEGYFAEANAPDTLEMMPFESGVELRSRSRTKGQVVAEILAEAPKEVPTAFLGDVWTDEDGFAEIRGRGLGILVRPETRESRADFHLTPPGELLEFLDEWLENAKESV